MSKFTHTKLKAFKSGSMNVVSQINKKDDNQKKKMEEEETAQVYQEFIETFQETSKVNKAWVKGGTVMPGSTGDSVKQEHSSDRIYKPQVKYGDKNNERRSDKDRDEDRRHNMKPYLPGKKKDEKKKSNLEIFKEELKAIQEQRQSRHERRRHDSSDRSRSRSPPDRHVSENESSHRSSQNVDNNSSRRSTRFDAGNQQQPSGRSLLGGIAPPNDTDYPYDYEGDKSTTNLFLGNLNPVMTETQLCELFGHFGPLASVKVMWPRTEEERARGRNCGFVAFMSRQDGERALEALKGREILNFEMKLGWGKNVAIPAHPIYVPPALMEMIKPPPPSNLPFNAQPREWLQSVRSKIKERSRSRGLLTRGEEAESSIERKPFDVDMMDKEEFNKILENSVVKVVIPTDRTLLALINRMVEFVCREGPIFEAMIMNREINNPMFKYLFDYQSPEHVYYRWRLFSILHGDSGQRWRTEEFCMYSGGPTWRPPLMDIYTSGMPHGLVDENDFPYQTGPGTGSHKTDDKLEFEEMKSQHEPETEQPRRSGLSDSQRERLDEMLTDLEPVRQKIGEVMCWCLEHAESADDITDTIAKSLNIHQISLNRKVARLFLASDILYNSSAKVPKASYFRRSFESRLIGIFKDLSDYLHTFESRMKAEQFKQKIMLCFRAWEDWAIYPNDFLIKLQNVFLGLERNKEGSTSHSPAAGGSANHSDEEEVDGKPLVDYDGDPLDIDGAPLDGADDLDGLPLFAEDAKSKKNSGTEKSSGNGHLFIPSKWETVDPDEEEEERFVVAAATSSKWEQEQVFDEEESSRLGGFDRNSRSVSRGRDDEDEEDVGDKSFKEDGEIDDDVDGKPLVAYDEDESSPYTSSRANLSSSDSSLMNERRRSKLREIEVKVMKYQDELESGRRGSKSSIGNISQLVERYRQRLLSEVEGPISSPKRSRHGEKDARDSTSTTSSRTDRKKPAVDSRSKKKTSRSPSRSRSRSCSHERRSLKSTVSSTTKKTAVRNASSKERRRSRSTERISSEVRKPRRSRSRSPQSSKSKSKSSTKSKK